MWAFSSGLADVGGGGNRVAARSRRPGRRVGQVHPCGRRNSGGAVSTIGSRHQGVFPHDAIHDRQPRRWRRRLIARNHRRTRLLFVASVAVLVLAGCGGGPAESASSSTPSNTITVAGAASL